MFVPALRLALTKIDGTVSPEALACALVDAASLERIESEFEAKINGSKVARGEPPTQLFRSRRTQIEQYTADAAALEAEQLAAFDEMSCITIATILKSGLDTDVQFWTNAAKHTHPADLLVVEELVNAKRALQKSLASCLAASSAHPA